MQAIAEPYLLEIFLKSLKVSALAVTLVAGVNLLERNAHLEVVRAVLVPQDIATPECCLI
jgi:hypothetical protein